MKDKSKTVVTVSKEAKEALAESVKKYEEKVLTHKGSTVDFTSGLCPCCTLFFRNNCEGCAIYKDTYLTLCDGTPYRNFGSGGFQTMSPELRTLIGAELDYLRDLYDRCEVEERWKAGSVWLYHTNEVTEILKDGEVRVLFNNIGSYISRVRQLSLDNIPFYAPPSKEQLDEWGMEIDRIDVPKRGDAFVNDRGTRGECVKGTDTMRTFDGLRYILKPRAVTKAPSWDEFYAEHGTELKNLLKGANK